MSFNVTDNKGNHLGIIFGKCSYSILSKEEQKHIWVCAITPYKVEDLGCDIYNIKNMWAEIWGLHITKSSEDLRAFTKKVNQLAKLYDITHLNDEEQLRYMHSKWELILRENKDKLNSQKRILINPLSAEFRNNRLIIDTNNNFNVTVEHNTTSVCAELISPINKVIYFDDKYEVNLKLKSGNVHFTYKLPFPVTNILPGDIIEFLYHNGSLKGVLIKNIQYSYSKEDSHGF